MFTGIIRHVGKVLSTQRTGAGMRIKIDLGPLAEGLSLGDSVAVGGACLTACAIDAPAAQFDVVTQTMSVTTLGGLRVGSRVNLERSLRASDALDGHLVQGHVDGIATVKSISTAGGECVIQFAAPRELTDLMVPRGSVAVDGVSLTLASVEAGGFSVALIPTTLAETTLSGVRAGDKVNIETDIIGKYIRKYLADLSAPAAQAQPSKGLTLDKLREEGFI